MGRPFFLPVSDLPGEGRIGSEFRVKTSDPKPLGLWMCTALVVGNMIGSGVFMLPASLAPYGWNAVMSAPLARWWSGLWYVFVVPFEVSVTVMVYSTSESAP